MRIEFAGIAAFPNEELNSLTLGAVGKGTTINHVQCTYNGDDAFEWFGGNVNANILLLIVLWMMILIPISGSAVVFNLVLHNAIVKLPTKAQANVLNQIMMVQVRIIFAHKSYFQ